MARDAKVQTALAAALLLVLAAFFIYLLVGGLKTGQIWELSKHHGRYVTKQDDPNGFWYSIAVYSVGVFGFVSCAIWIVARTFKKVRQ
jgi:H+/Cl- antiporter ClcA